MPVAERKTTPTRSDFSGSLTPTEVDHLVSDKDLRVLQAAKPVAAETWSLLNARFFALRPDVELRVYGHYGQPCDLSFLERMGNVRRFAADSLFEATRAEYISRLPGLVSLSIGIRSLDSLDFLADVQADHLTDLALGATSSKKPGLRCLERFAGLKRLYLESHKKDIEVIGDLPRLEELALRSVALPSLNFLGGLAALWSLDIKLGGTKDLAGLAQLTGIKYLELWQVRQLSDLSPLEGMTGLQFLFLQSLRNVAQLPRCSQMQALRRVYMENMKGLQSVTPLEEAPALEELIHVAAHGMEPAQYSGLLLKKSLKRMLVGFGSKRKNEALLGMMKAAGIEEYSYRPFCFA